MPMATRRSIDGSHLCGQEIINSNARAVANKDAADETMTVQDASSIGQRARQVPQDLEHYSSARGVDLRAPGGILPHEAELRVGCA